MLVREYTYAYATVSPHDGGLAWMLSARMDTVNMSAFLRHVSERYPKDFVLMVLDGAPAHRSHDLRVPSNMSLIRLPPYSPGLKPAERFWKELREKELGLKRLEDIPEFLRSLSGREWILSSL